MATLTMHTPAGPFTIIASDSSVLAAGFTADEAALLPMVSGRPGNADLDTVAKAVDAYFEGDLTAIDTVPVAQPTRSTFLAHAWQVLREIPARTQGTYR